MGLSRSTSDSAKRSEFGRSLPYVSSGGPGTENVRLRPPQAVPYQSKRIIKSESVPRIKVHIYPLFQITSKLTHSGLTHIRGIYDNNEATLKSVFDYQISEVLFYIL